MDQSKKEYVLYKKYAYIIYGFALLFGLFNVVFQKNRLESEIAATNVERAWRGQNFDRVLRESRGIKDSFYSLNPFTLPFEYYKGMSFSYKNQTKLAINSFAKAYSQNPYQIMVINNYGTILNLSGKLTEAKELYRKSIEISPRFIDGNLNLASLLHNEKKVDEAYNLLLNLKYQSNHERYQHVLITVLKQKLYKEYKLSKDEKVRAYIVQILKSDKELLGFHRKVLSKNNDFNPALLELSNK